MDKDKGKYCWFSFTAVVLTSIGAINWGLVALFKFNLVDALFAGMGLDKAIYVVVALSGVYVLWHKITKLLTSK